MAQLPSELISHSRRVCNLYKRVLRSLEDYHHNRLDLRYESVLMRQRFEENRNIRDARIAKQILLDAEETLFKTMHWQPKKFANSVGGVAYEREVLPPDSVLDYWHPMEKAQYPKYFARREELKKEYEELYNKMFPEIPKPAADK
ncbi:NADH dehydrogenase [ubiquinone] 1 beta subcomplex subunit 9 [Hylaeus volcanicus]|uniref:NADH dehydrogenase [ubiquinone] 1 beta subcomplex subunit 9 n=1 Tax=Hylaeus volcanicus TaxID=313075 RepID=UPI0023B86FCE|nr:NADH dehydrogenase [ubiquinone] 1 beta subcomplex subunit 9 [Hylaeus volcanicus]